MTEDSNKAQEKLNKIVKFCKEKRYIQEQIYTDTYESEPVWIYLDYIIQMGEE